MPLWLPSVVVNWTPGQAFELWAGGHWRHRDRVRTNSGWAYAGMEGCGRLGVSRKCYSCVGLSRESSFSMSHGASGWKRRKRG